MKDILLTELKVSPCNVRRMTSTKIKEGMEDMKASIKSKGVIEPLVVRKGKDGFEVMVGQRRFLSAKAVGLKELPCVIKELSDQEAIEYSLIENLQRKDLDPIDVAEGLKKLYDIRKDFAVTAKSSHKKYTINDFAKEIASMGMMKEREVYNLLSLVSLAPELKEMVADGEITIESGAKLKQLDEAGQEEFARVFSETVETNPITQIEEKEIVDRTVKGEDPKAVIKDVTEKMSPDYIVLVVKTDKGTSQFRMRRKYYDWLGEVAERRKMSTFGLLDDIIREKLKEWGYKI